MLGDLRARRGRRGRASRTVGLLLLGLLVSISLVFAAPDAGASSKHRSVVVHSLHPRPHLRAFWSAERMRRAKPIRPRRLAGRPDRGAGLGLRPLPSYVPSSLPGEVGGLTAALGVVPAAAGPTAEGTDTGSSTVFPNSANGVVFFSYGPGDYRCSGSVVSSPAGRAVLTAGHCVIDPGPGTQATNIAFVPGFRDGAEPFDEWPATSFATTSRWQSTAGTGDPNDADEAGDMAILTLANRPSDGASVQSVVGGVGMGFNQPRLQTYNEYGYPAEFPYDGTRLYRLTAPWANDDASFSPPTMGIESDFTGGSSGGPWLVGSPPVALSVSDYRYIFPPQSAYMYGPYFGALAQQLYAAAVGSTPTSTGSDTPASNRFSVRLISRNRQRGVALLGVEVPGAGTLVLSGESLRRISRQPSQARTVALPVHATGSALGTLRDAGRIAVEAEIAFAPTGGSANEKTRRVVLVRRR